METLSFNALAERFLGTRLPGWLSDSISFPELSPDAKGVVLRLLSLMQRSLCPATEFNTQMIWLLANVTPGMLPSAWGGRIPPVTSPGRHRKLDDYVMKQTRVSDGSQPVYIDIGCGFPPATTVDTARRLPDWSVFGVDRWFARYVLYDADGNYACFDRDGKLQYLQARTKPLNDNPPASKEQFNLLFADLYPKLTMVGEHCSETVEIDGNRLVRNHVRDFEGKNIKFIESEIDDLQLPAAGAIRCMNVLLYFEKDFREIMQASMSTLLDHDGVLITGFNHPFGIYARYVINKKGRHEIFPSEFAFSPDNLRPLGVGPWLTLADEDREAELLADVTGAIRADRHFWPEFNPYVDELRTKYGICRRDSDGFIHFTEEARTASPSVIMEKTSALWSQLEEEGYTDGAVDALERAGYQAWKNAVGDIAVLPPEGSLPKFEVMEQKDGVEP
jgi:hypothetical protein